MKTSKIITLLIGITCLLLLFNSCDSNTTKPNPVTGISLNQTTLSMQIGDTRTLTAIITPENATNKAVLWSSSDERVATVNDTGSILAISDGSTLITATTIDGGFSAICVVTVNPNTPNIPVTGVALNKSNTSILIGNTEALTAIITPSNATNQNVSWTSSNSSIATVSDTGVVTAIAQGTATITVTTQDGGFTDTCQVTVSETIIPVTGVSLNHSSLSLDVGSTETLIATITPTNATNQNVSWTSSNSSIATVSDTGVVTAITQGTATITVTTQDGGFTDTCLITVNPDPTATVIINITTSDGGSVIGATVVLQNHTGGAYQETATSSSVILTNIPFGLYSVIVSHSGYHPFIDETLSVQSHTVTHAVHLLSTTVHIGDIIPFGAYTWRVLDIQGGQALIVSENIIEMRNYHTSIVAITWAECSLRAYLNGDFYNSSAFSNEDRSRIVQVTNVNLDNQWYGTNGGINTQDRIFLLSIAEVVQYFGDSGQLENRPPGASWIDDQYNSNRIATFNGTASWWWLRSPGFYTGAASFVRTGGYLDMSGYNVDLSNNGVRPALWLNL